MKTCRAIEIAAEHLTHEFKYAGKVVKIGKFDPETYPVMFDGPIEEMPDHEIEDQLVDAKIFSDAELAKIEDMDADEFAACISSIVPVFDSLEEVVDAYFNNNNMHRIEGRRGVENLCRFARDLGYKDPQYWGQLTSKAAVGDLIMMLEDNSGMIEAMIEWVKTTNNSEFKTNLEMHL